MSKNNLKTQKPSQDTIDSLFQEISDDLMESINGGFAVRANGSCHGQLAVAKSVASLSVIG